MSTKYQTYCDNCKKQIDAENSDVEFEFNLTSLRRGATYSTTDPLPEGRDFCSLECTATWIEKKLAEKPALKGSVQRAAARALSRRPSLDAHETNT